MAMRYRILVVEDDADIRHCLGELLEGEGYEVIAAPTGEEGLAILRRTRFDLVVSDYSLPGRTGTVMLRDAAREGCLTNTRSILVTAHPRPSIDAGVKLVRKPLDPYRFLDVVAQEIKSRSRDGTEGSSRSTRSPS